MPFCGTEKRRICMITKQHVGDHMSEFISWDSMSTHYEASNIVCLIYAATYTAGCVDREREVATMVSPSLDQSRNDNTYMEFGILQILCAIIQDWRISDGTPVSIQANTLPLQLSLPMLHKYPPTSRNLDSVEMEILLSYRTEKVLRFSCFARRGKGSLGPSDGQPVPVNPIVSYQLGMETTESVMEFNNTGYAGFVETRFFGSAAERSVCLQMVMDEIWNDVEKQLTVWEQLYLRACVKIYFVHFWKANKEEWKQANREMP